MFKEGGRRIWKKKRLCYRYTGANLNKNIYHINPEDFIREDGGPLVGGWWNKVGGVDFYRVRNNTKMGKSRNPERQQTAPYTQCLIGYPGSFFKGKKGTMSKQKAATLIGRSWERLLVKKG